MKPSLTVALPDSSPASQQLSLIAAQLRRSPA